MDHRVTFRFASPDDAQLLAPMNGRLIVDEGHRNPMTVAELALRMEAWLRADYRAVIATEGGPLGYLLFREASDHVYLRQLFVEKPHRRQGVGRSLLAWFAQNALSQPTRVRVEVLVLNAPARQFWRAAGFTDYAITLEHHLGAREQSANLPLRAPGRRLT